MRMAEVAEFQRRVWEPDPAGLTRRDRRPCEYDTYLPDKLLARNYLLTGETAADVVDAENAVTTLNVRANALASTEVLARILLRAESVASSRIEGLVVGPRRLLEAEVAREIDGATSDVTAAEVLANVDAMNRAIELSSEGVNITPDLLCDVHRSLLAGTAAEQFSGSFRKEQNWIGGSSFNPCSAAFVPPPPELVEDLVDDLCAFCNDDSLPAIAQAAIAHAQFETVHPFVDGNGRTGRALVHMIMRRRGLAPRVQPPISLVLATISSDYIEGLGAYRYEGESDSTQAVDGVNRWIALFAGACTRAVADAVGFEDWMREIEVEWRMRLGRVRRGSSVDLLLGLLPGAPVITVGGASAMLGRSFAAVNNAVAVLVDVGILRQVNVGRRNRAFESAEVIEAFIGFEPQIASSVDDTRVERPVRPTPSRPR
ncbi:MAG: Fic family protein [Coriobacteriia bacterium]|nr:Fic family protein [Coriobacteriia bacterium]